jgi:hypothetical protein
MKIELKGRRFDTVEEMLMVLNTLTKMDFQGCISKVAETLGSVCALPRELL